LWPISHNHCHKIFFALICRRFPKAYIYASPFLYSPTRFIRPSSPNAQTPTLSHLVPPLFFLNSSPILRHHCLICGVHCKFCKEACGAGDIVNQLFQNCETGVPTTLSGWAVAGVGVCGSGSVGISRTIGALASWGVVHTALWAAKERRSVWVHQRWCASWATKVGSGCGEWQTASGALSHVSGIYVACNLFLFIFHLGCV